MTVCLHIGHPTDRQAYGLGACVQSLVQNGSVRKLCGDWQVAIHPYNEASSLDVIDFCSNVRARSGPVLLLNPIKGKVLADIRERLNGRAIVLVADAYEGETAVLAQIGELKRAYDAGEPFLPTDVVVGLLILRKLEREHFWGGKDKGYMWRENIPKGRGLDEGFASRVEPVLHALLNTSGDEYLIKKTSNSKPKYALNPDRKQAVYDALRGRDFLGRVGQLLRRHPGTVSARELEDLDDYEVGQDEAGKEQVV